MKKFLEGVYQHLLNEKFGYYVPGYMRILRFSWRELTPSELQELREDMKLLQFLLPAMREQGLEYYYALDDYLAFLEAQFQER